MRRYLAEFALAYTVAQRPIRTTGARRLDIPQKLEDLFQTALDELSTSPERVSETTLRIVGVYRLRQQVMGGADWKLSLPRSIGSEATPRVVKQFEKSLKKAERAHLDDDYDSQSGLVDELTTYCRRNRDGLPITAFNRLVRTQLSTMFLRLDVEVWRQWIGLISNMPMTESTDQYFSYSDLLKQVEITSPDLLFGRSQRDERPSIQFGDTGVVEAIVRNAIGRPKEDWESIKRHLLDIEEQESLPDIAHGWRTIVSDILYQRYKPHAISPKLQSKTIRNKPIIKDELDRIETQHSKGHKL